MSEIAFNISGEPFDPPPATAAWRVRKLKSKGAPEVVYGRDGLPLFLPRDADIEELRREVQLMQLVEDGFVVFRSHSRIDQCVEAVHGLTGCIVYASARVARVLA